MAAVVTTSVACSCCGQTNCIVTKVTTTGRRDPSCHRSCLPSPWRLTQRSASTHRFKYHYVMWPYTTKSVATRQVALRTNSREFQANIINPVTA